jgi:general secretion pathway protein N
LELIGTIVGESDAIGVFFNQATHSVLRLKTGEAHEGWILREVKRRDVSLEKGTQNILLALPLPQSGSVAPPQRSAAEQPQRSAGSSGARADERKPAVAESSTPPTPNGRAPDASQAPGPSAIFTPPPAVFPQLQPEATAQNPFHLELIRR